METHGSIEELKKAIEADYAQKINELNKGKTAQIKEIKASAKKELSLLETELEQESEAKAREAGAMVLNEQKLAAKRGFEEAREAMIQEVIETVKGKFPSTMKTKQYADFVKKRTPKGAKAHGNAFFKKKFKGLKEEKGVNGLRFEKGSVIFDLSLDALFEAKEPAVREKVIEKLW